MKLKHNEYDRFCECILCERKRNAKKKEEERELREKLRPRYEREPGSFDLETGMKDLDVVNTLRGYVSGETAQEVQRFFDVTEHEKSKLYKEYVKFATPTFKDFHVVAADVDRKYALIEKASYSAGNESLSQTTTHFLTGINDDGKYFVHPLFDVPQELLVTAYSGNIRPLIDWVDRADEGFDRRIQGDILIQYRDNSELDNISMHRQTTGRWQNNVNSAMSISGSMVRLADMVFQEPNHPTAEGPHILTLKMHPPSASVSKIRTFGRHQLITDGRIEMVHDDQDGEGTQYYIVQGNQLLIQHPEHQKTQEAIPQGKFAIITNQRGRQREQRFD